MAGLTVLVDDSVQGVAVRAGSSGKGQQCLGLRRDADPHSQDAGRVQAGVQGDIPRCGYAGCRGVGDPLQMCEWLVAGAVAAEPALPVRLHADLQHLRLHIREEMRGLQRALGRQPGCAREDERLLARLPVALDKQVAKRRMGLVGAGIGQRHLEGRQQLDIHHLVAQVAQLDLAKLHVVLGADPHRCVGLDVRPQGVETHPVGVVGAAVAGAAVGCRMLRDGCHGPLASAAAFGRTGPAQIKEASAVVTQGVVAPARDAGLSAAAPAGAVRTQGHAIAAIGQNMGWLHRKCAG